MENVDQQPVQFCAFAKVTTAAGGVTFVTRRGFTSAARSAAGKYQFTLSSPIPVDEQINTVTVTTTPAAPAGALLSAQATSATVVEVSTTNGTAFADGISFSLETKRVLPT